MKLSEVKTEGKFKGLIMGDPGEGKTVFTASFPTPIKFLDFDNKVDSAALFYKNDRTRLENIDVENLSSSMIEDPIARLNEIIDKEFVPAQKKGAMPFKTLVIDSATTFSSAVLKHIVKTNPGIKRVTTKQGVQPGLQDYGILKREFTKLIPGLLSLNCNVIMTAHFHIDKDENTGELNRIPLMDGGFAAQLPVYFKEVWRLYAKDKKRWVQTQSDRKFKCRSQIPGLPDPFDITEGYKALEQYLK